MNKNGWGLRVELAFLLLFLICLLISTIGLHKMGILGTDEGVYTDDGTINENVNFDYNSLEKKVTESAEVYYKDMYPNGSDDTIVVSTSKLKSGGYLESITDAKGRECIGYAIILKTKNIVSYIKCGIYKTAGYSEDYE